MIALSVAAVLAVFVVYTAFVGKGIADVTPSTVAGHTGDVSLVGTVVGKPRGDAYHGGMRFLVKDVRSKDTARVPVMYRGSVPDLFRSGRDVVVEGTMRNGTFVAKPGSLVTKCPDHYAPAKSSKT